ncbi:MAG: lipid A phosphoethanolamine transferase [Prevotella sp.]|jgi:glucan phosphoethanolaminetransferase (alkaline phosphatase superfamily)|nr:lipid A phosphoethanolamine transferase [Prevotella sp.]
MELKKHLNGFIENPVRLFIFFVIVNLLPTLGLVFTEPFDIWGKTILILLPLGLYFVLFSLLRNIGLAQLILIPLLIIHAFQIVVFYLFGESVIAADMFLNVVTTNVSEAGEVLQGVIASVIFVVIVYIPTIAIAAIACRRKVCLGKEFRIKVLIIGILAISTSSELSFIAENKDRGNYAIYEDAYPVDVFCNLKFARQKWIKSKHYKETSKNFIFNANKNENAAQREIYVLVIGETSRADNWGLYGYERNTTPNLERDSNIVLFKDVLTQSNTTHKSVSIMLTAASAENYGIIYEQKSMIEAFKEVGFSTVFISNQSANHTFTDYFAQEADYTDYYRHFNEKTNNLDEIILPQFRHYIDSIPGNIFFIIHSYGSHFNYKERYPKEFSIFKPDNVGEISRANRDILVNAYDNTILYTDKFLYDIITVLNQTEACTSMLYVSDHGEDILDDDRQKFLHASPNPTYYQLRIPMFIWLSPIYKENFLPNAMNAYNNESKPVSTNAVFHTMLDMAQISTSYLNPEFSLVNSQFKIAKRTYLNDHDEPIFFYNAGLKEEDKIMIEKKNIHH